MQAPPQGAAARCRPPASAPYSSNPSFGCERSVNSQREQLGRRARLLAPSRSPGRLQQARLAFLSRPRKYHTNKRPKGSRVKRAAQPGCQIWAPRRPAPAASFPKKIPSARVSSRGLAWLSRLQLFGRFPGAVFRGGIVLVRANCYFRREGFWALRGAAAAALPLPRRDFIGLLRFSFCLIALTQVKPAPQSLTWGRRSLAAALPSLRPVATGSEWGRLDFLQRRLFPLRIGRSLWGGCVARLTGRQL